ncbi:hypothetical protein OHA72_22380 [Dactylosporangium sp. NBC_01737]|uniref:hypothetical protein n=1 Tax=Dactylosporangium sp. NBC_01737 TaxID=2975959 RepID=UPI002E12C767|nr:hypothetical protein OHA72_22380 [Dactylosporangium sp. NBC_01737]
MAEAVSTAVANSFFGQLEQMMIAAALWTIDICATWWVAVPSLSLYPDPQQITASSTPIDAVTHLRSLIMPITAAVAVGGILWQAILMVLTRKPAPLVNVLRGLWNTSLWAAVGTFGTQLLLTGCDQFSTAVLNAALQSVGDPSLGKRLGALAVPASGGGFPQIVVILAATLAMIASLTQAFLMLFRDGSVVVLAALTPLAAAGSFTNATNGWMKKLLAWQLALIFYKPIAAMVYATAIWVTGENTSKDPRILFVGLAMMAIALVALPVLMKFFNWTIGSLQSGNGGLGMFATAGAAGMHAASSMLGGFDAGMHARYLADTFDRAGPANRPGGADPGPGPSGPGSGPDDRDPPKPGSGPTPGQGPGSGGAPGPGGGLKPPTFVGEAGPGKVANITSAGDPAGAAASSTATAPTAATGAASAAGPAGLAVVGAGEVVGAVTETASAAANAAANALDDPTKEA